MIVLSDTIEISAPAKEIYLFFLRFQENYLAWHPDHTFCRYLTDGPMGIGSVIYIEELLHGKPHKLKLRITRLEPYSLIEYHNFMGTKGLFLFEQKSSDSTLFTAELRFGLDIPILEKLLDPILRLLLSRQLKGIHKHIKEEGENLKRIVERGR